MVNQENNFNNKTPKKIKKESEVKWQNNFTVEILTLKCNDCLQKVTSGSAQKQINDIFRAGVTKLKRNIKARFFLVDIHLCLKLKLGLLDG